MRRPSAADSAITYRPSRPSSGGYHAIDLTLSHWHTHSDHSAAGAVHAPFLALSRKNFPPPADVWFFPNRDGTERSAALRPYEREARLAVGDFSKRLRGFRKDHFEGWTHISDRRAPFRHSFPR